MADEIDELTDGLESITIDTSRSKISRLTSGMFVCSVCELAQETFGQLRRHVKDVHSEDLDTLKRQINELEKIPRDELTQAQIHNLVVLRRRRGFLRKFR